MPDRLSTQIQQAPHSIETGTLNHAALNGVISALDFISTLGEGNSFREKIISALENIQSHEKELARWLYGAIRVMKQFQVIGPDFDQGLRAPTISFYHRNKNSSDVSLELANNGFGTSYGHFYASRAIEVLGLKPYGGVVRLGISLYHNREDIEKMTEALKLI
jgi:selenocysteine lyase/cysteine desulfurase